MKKTIQNITMAVFLITAFLCAPTAQAKEEDLQRECRDAIANFLKNDSTLQKFFDTSAGYAVFPSVGKGGFVVGGAHGKGLVFEKGNPIGKATMSQASVGAQVGGQSFAEVIFFETSTALRDFESGKFEMSAEVSAVVVKQGASAAAHYKNGVAVFTLPKKGLMAQASIGGQKFKFEPLPLQPTGRPPSK
jgi:lipid-binding SYLF domain-containing protein